LGVARLVLLVVCVSLRGRMFTSTDARVFGPGHPLYL